MSRVTIHMASSLDGYIARKDGAVDWLETDDHFDGGVAMTPEFFTEFFKTVDCWVMGSRTYETAHDFDAKGMGWPYGDKPTFVLTRRDLPKTRDRVEFHSGDLTALIESLRKRFKSIWIAGGGALAGECLRRGLADEIVYALLPVLIGDGLSFFDRLDRDVPLHLVESKAYDSGMVELRYAVKQTR